VEFLPDSGHAVLGESGETKSRRPRRNHTPDFGAKVALAAIKGDRTLAELAEQFDVQAYLRAYGSVSRARTSRGRYLDFYNGCRPHSTLDRRTPDQAYFTPLPVRMAA